MKIGVLVSGELGLICLTRLREVHEILFVMTDKGSDAIIKLSSENTIPLFVGNPRQGKAASFIRQFHPDVVFSINYLFVIETDVISIAKKYALNFHGSLLPKYRGRTPHVWAIINNEKQTGVTAHLMEEGCDEGPIIFQEPISIHEDDTGAAVLRNFFTKYPDIVLHVAKMIEEGTVKPQPQDHSKATFFGKRVPDDGEINWNWHKERIRNWVRAQAQPYPGAFTFYKGTKIVINKISFSDKGFDYQDTNGKILSAEGRLVVKTPNGAVELMDFVSENNIQFKTGDILHGRH